MDCWFRASPHKCKYFYIHDVILIFCLSIKAIKEEYPGKDTKILPCFFHFSQALWRRANGMGLRQQKYIQETKSLILNLKALCFNKLDDVCLIQPWDICWLFEIFRWNLDEWKTLLPSSLELFWRLFIFLVSSLYQLLYLNRFGDKRKNFPQW